MAHSTARAAEQSCSCGGVGARAMRALGRPALSVGETNTKSSPKRGEESKSESEHVFAHFWFSMAEFIVYTCSL